MTIKDSLDGAPAEFAETPTSAQVVVLGSLHLDILVHAVTHTEGEGGHR